MPHGGDVCARLLERPASARQLTAIAWK